MAGGALLGWPGVIGGVVGVLIAGAISIKPWRRPSISQRLRDAEDLTERWRRLTTDLRRGQP